MPTQANIKRLIRFSLAGFFLLLLSGCGFAGRPDGGVYKSVNQGETFEQKTYISEKASISNANILSMEIDPSDSQILYVGTSNSGLYRSTDGGEKWIRDINNFENIYFCISKITKCSLILLK